MTREIKFRAWNKKERIMIDDTTIHTITFSGKVWRVSSSIFKDETKDFELMQYTGLKDRTGKEIYEGDILKDDVGDILEVKFGKLPLDKSGDCVCSYQSFYCKNYGQLGQSPSNKCQDIGNWMLVIGNKFENPELLK